VEGGAAGEGCEEEDTAGAECEEEDTARAECEEEDTARAEGGSTGEDAAGVDAGGEGEVSQKGSGTKGRGCHSYLVLSSSSSSSLWGC